TLINNLKDFIVSIIRLAFCFEISPTVKESSPNRTGTRTKALFLNCVGLSGYSITLLINSLTALEPISMAANFRIFSINSLFYIGILFEGLFLFHIIIIGSKL